MTEIENPESWFMKCEKVNWFSVVWEWIVHWPHIGCEGQRG